MAGFQRGGLQRGRLSGKGAFREGGFQKGKLTERGVFREENFQRGGLSGLSERWAFREGSLSEIGTL